MTLARMLRERMKFVPGNVSVLEEAGQRGSQSTAANVRRAMSAFRPRMTANDLLLVVLIGHGTFDGTDAKFNLVGPDLESAEWAALLDGLPGRVVIVVNTASAAFPFLERLAGPRRSRDLGDRRRRRSASTPSFPEFFIHALEDPAADIDKNGRISIWEAFAAATAPSAATTSSQGSSRPRRALLDDNGDGVGHEPCGSSDDGTMASSIYLDEPDARCAADGRSAGAAAPAAGGARNAKSEELKIRRQFLPPADYQKEFERIMVALAQVQRDIRDRRGSL